MRSRLLLVLVLVVLLTWAGVRPAQGDGYYFYAFYAGNGTCKGDGINGEITFDLGFTWNMPDSDSLIGEIDYLNGVQVENFPPDDYGFEGSGTNVTQGYGTGDAESATPPFTFEFAYRFYAGSTEVDHSEITVHCDANYGFSITVTNSHQVQTTGVTWFAPGDCRYDGRPGDRIAVCCENDSLHVYGVRPDSRGFLLSTFKYTDLLQAGMKGIFVDKARDGVVSADTDGKGDFWVAWNGGKYYADGQPHDGFAKLIVCTQPQALAPAGTDD